MTTDFLHGVEVVEIDDGLRPIQIVKSAVIGIVGTAPDAQGALTAARTLGTGDAGLTLTAQAAGAAGNLIRVALRDPAAAGQTLAVAVDGTAITVTLATDGSGAITSTAEDVKLAIEADAAAAALIAVTYPGTGDGSGVMLAGAGTLAGGEDEPFPLNTPVLVAGNRIQTAKLDPAGARQGTLPRAMDLIFAETAPEIVVIRVAEGGDEAATISNIIGGVDGTTEAHTGIYALLAAQAATLVTPRILIAPGYSQNLAVAQALVGVADQLRAFAYVTGPNTNRIDAIAFENQIGSARCAIVDPFVRVWDSATNGYIATPGDPTVAAITAKTDHERGFWWSPSNKVAGISGTARPIPNTGPIGEANALTEHGIVTFIVDNGWRSWGNRTCSGDPLWAFIAVRRTADMIYESAERAFLWAQDRPFSAQLLRDIQDSVQAFMDNLVTRGASLGGTVWIDPDLNTEATLKAGQLYLDFDFEPPAPMERLTLRAHRNGGYYEELIADVTA
jgi:phage tail sheath protein FI